MKNECVSHIFVVTVILVLFNMEKKKRINEILVETCSTNVCFGDLKDLISGSNPINYKIFAYLRHKPLM